MAEETIPIGLQPKELEAVYAISRAVARSVNVEEALNEIIQIIRGVLIFDNMTMFIPREGDLLEPTTSSDDLTIIKMTIQFTIFRIIKM